MSSLGQSIHASTPSDSIAGTPSQGGRENPNREKSTCCTWTFDEMFGQVIHESDCPTCEHFMEHTGYGSGALSQRVSFRAAMGKRDNFILNGAGVLSRISVLESKNLQLTDDKRKLIDQLESRKRAYHELEDDYEDSQKTLESARLEIKEMGKEIARLHDEISERQNKKRRIDSSVTPGATTSRNDDSMLVDDEGGPGVNTASSAGMTTGVAETSQSSANTSVYQKWKIPTSIPEAQVIIDALRRSEEAGKPNQKAFRFLRNANNNAVKVPLSGRSEFHKFMIENFWIPEEFKPKDKQKEAERENSSVNGTSNVTNNTVVTGNLPGTPGTSSGSKKSKSKGNSTLATFPKNSSLETMLGSICKEMASGKCRTGILRNDDGSISVRAVMGLQFFYERAPRSRHGASPAQRYRYHFAFVELVLTPGFYRSHVEQNPIQFPAPAVERYPGEAANVNINDLAAFFGRQGVTVAVVENVAYWAAHWLASIQVSDVYLRVDLQQLKDRLYPLLSVHGLPAGFNDNIFYPDGRLVERPARAILDIPGAPTVLGNPNALTSGTSQESPAETVDNHDVEMDLEKKIEDKGMGASGNNPESLSTAQISEPNQ
ncbi:hypothetical protein PM082_014724 [Marasmius tenuissimus]|nr:hypothetical protein PM082_014724 [Marasmius tenuissimus]